MSGAQSADHGRGRELILCLPILHPPPGKIGRVAAREYSPVGPDWSLVIVSVQALLDKLK